MFEIDFSKVPVIKDVDKTILEIGKNLHYENVISNYLQFYLNPNNNHGFDDLLLKIIFNLWDNEKEIFYSESLQIKREVSTDKGRIDLLIIGDDFVMDSPQLFGHLTRCM